jgi:integrase
MAMPSKPWFRSSKGAWYVKVQGKQTALGVRGEANEAEAVKAWHRLLGGLPLACGGETPLESHRKPRQAHETPQAVPTVAEVLSAFLSDAESRVQPITLAFYRRFLLPFSERHGTKKAEALTPTVAEAYSRKPTWSSSTRNDCLGTLATAFRWAERSRLLVRSPLAGLKLPPKESQGAEAVVSEGDYAKMMTATKGDFKALLRFLWLTGCRPSEATGLTVEAVDWTSACVVLKRHKTAHKGKARVIYLSAEALAVVEAQRKRHGAGLLFRNANGRAWGRKVLAHKMWRLQRKLGIRATAYGFRHTFASEALSNGVPDAHVAELLGHAGTAMLHKHYAHLGAKARALREALGKVRA